MTSTSLNNLDSLIPASLGIKTMNSDIFVRMQEKKSLALILEFKIFEIEYEKYDTSFNDKVKILL